MADLPDSVDCLVLGTGLVNSILAAACARIGKSVLHIDNKGYYGDEWASFTYQQLREWIDTNQRPIEPIVSPEDSKDEINTFRPLRESLFSNVEFIDNTNTESEVEDKGETSADAQSGSQNSLITKSRYFCFDLAPHLIYSDAPIVELLVKSNVARYHEFKNSIKILSWVDGKLHSVPFTRPDLFSSSIGLIDRRRLMQFLEACFAFESDNPDESPNQDENSIIVNSHLSISEYLEKRQLNETLRSYLIDSVAMVDSQTSTIEACKSVKKFLSSFQRFGKSPFLVPMYGCGEFPQSFCRLSAVFGGIYCLNKQIKSMKLIKTENSTDPVHFIATLDDKKIRCNKIVMKRSDAANFRMLSSDSNEVKLSRAIVVTNRSLYPSDQDTLYFLRIPSGSFGNKNPIHVLEVNSSVLVAPPDLFILYLWTESTNSTAKEDLHQVVEKLLGADKCHHFSCFYNQKTTRDSSLIKIFDQIYLTSAPSGYIDYDHTIKESERIFKLMYPGEEFLPRAPDPDEIVFQGGDEDQEAMS